MGTNHYAKPRDDGATLHIGKQNAGRRYMFNALSGRATTFRSWRTTLMSVHYEIVDEWGTKRATDAFFEQVEASQACPVEPSASEKWFLDGDGFEFFMGDWE